MLSIVLRAPSLNLLTTIDFPLNNLWLLVALYTLRNAPSVKLSLLITNRITSASCHTRVFISKVEIDISVPLDATTTAEG